MHFKSNFSGFIYLRNFQKSYFPEHILTASLIIYLIHILVACFVWCAIITRYHRDYKFWCGIEPRKALLTAKFAILIGVKTYLSIKNTILFVAYAGRNLPG